MDGNVNSCAILRLGVSLCASLLPRVVLLILIAAIQKFRIPGSLIFLYRRRNRVVGFRIEQTFFRGVI